jgi:hypothetical protein
VLFTGPGTTPDNLSEDIKVSTQGLLAHSRSRSSQAQLSDDPELPDGQLYRYCKRCTMTACHQFRVLISIASLMLRREAEADARSPLQHLQRVCRLPLCFLSSGCADSFCRCTGAC